ncbi:MAG: MerR family transcriptional regulator [Gammaproteobacteria bacterium]|nr:MerR family transcriptional regulator [Gammaproteobacteria bacterium]MBU0786548.1 MerR family transcriptional regulator [Gammaproteobacteria bacterium]MBU0817156.1 MerR family transcriptional regulator [Gammaproteobacteria bacterium]MBU1787723.1 MerR family transcriptional regulator [Gammaproteobacteria bacterium]
MQMIELAQASGVSLDTVRYYTRLGLIRAERREGNGYQKFSSRTVHRIQFIRSAVGLGFKLKDVAELLGMSEQGVLPCPKAREILAERLHEKEKQIEREIALFRQMQNAIEAWELMPDGIPEGRHVCGLIEGFEPDKRIEV